MLTIRDINGRELLSVEIGKGSKRVFSLMKDDYISLKFSLAEPIRFGIGSYVIVDGFGRFELTDLYQPKQNSKTGGWDYDIRFDAHYIKWKNKIFKYTPENASGEASWNLTAALDVHIGIFLRNLTALGYDYNGTPYTFDIDNTVSNTARLVTYENKNLLDSLYEMADKFECEVWVTDSIIHFGRCEFGDVIEFRQDRNVESMTPEGNRATYATRIYAFGSERNLPKDYRPTAPNITVNGVVQRRLMLPADTPYIDSAAGLATVEAVEQVIIFDDVYPRTKSAISDITTKAYNVIDENNNATGETWDAYRFKLPNFEFKEEYILPAAELQVVFQTGSLAGMTFNVKFNPEAEPESDPSCQLWEIIRNEDYGRPLPDGTLKPNDGDEIILIGWDSTKISSLGLVANAEQELKQRAIEKSERLKIDPANYRCKMISASMFDDGGVWHPCTVGSRVRLVNQGCFDGGERVSRIIGYEYDLALPFNSPIYIVGEKANNSRTKELESKVESLTLAGQTYTGGGGGSGVYVIRTNDTTAPTDANVYSALRTKRDFLSRVLADVALGKITFADGLEALRKATFADDVQFGSSFASGVTGVGGKIDNRGHGELDSLSLRSWLEVPEIRYNRAEVILGDQWRAPGGGIIDSVSVDVDANDNPLRTGTITLKLEDGEIGAIAVDDICKGYFHDFKTPANNATSDVDDSRGNTQFSGFCTIFFRVTEVLGSDGTNKRFRYMLRSESARWPHSFHPFEGMHFVAYGNFTRTDRQKSAYETRTYTRHLVGVNDWEFSDSMIAMQFGDLSNLSVFGLEMAGYSAYLNNIYMTGVIKQTDPAILPRLEVETSTGDTLVPAGQSVTLSCAIRRGWDDITAQATAWAISRDSGNPAADQAWADANSPSFSGSIVIASSDIGASAYSASSIFRIRATGPWGDLEKAVALHTVFQQQSVVIVDEGPWVEGGDYKCQRLISDPISPYFGYVVTSDVWHDGCRWRCAQDRAQDEPRWKSPQWTFVEGSPDFTVRFLGWSDQDRFDFDFFDLTLTAQCTLYNQDISDDDIGGVAAITYDWERRVIDADGNEMANSDLAWTLAHQNAGRTLHLTSADIGLSRVPRLLRFTVTAILADSRQAQAAFEIS